MGVTHRVSYGEVLSYQPRAMFKPGIMILLLAVLTVHVVQIAGARQVPPGYEDLILHGKFDGFDRRILPGGADKTTQASSIAAISTLGRASFATPPPRCPAYHCVASITKQCCLRPRNKRGKYVPCRFVRSC